jgi:hypothetical protein
MHSEEGRENNKMRQPKIKKIVSEKTTFEVRPNNLFSYFGCFVKLIFSAEFRSLTSFGHGNSVKLGMPRNEHFLPWNNGYCSESILRNFFRMKFRS